MRRFEEPKAGKELADVAIGTGLVVAGPAVAEKVFDGFSEASGSNVSFSPDNEFLKNFTETGVDVAQGVAGVAATAMIIYLGFKKMMSGLRFKEKK